MLVWYDVSIVSMGKRIRDVTFHILERTINNASMRQHTCHVPRYAHQRRRLSLHQCKKASAAFRATFFRDAIDHYTSVQSHFTHLAPVFPRCGETSTYLCNDVKHLVYPALSKCWLMNSTFATSSVSVSFTFATSHLGHEMWKKAAQPSLSTILLTISNQQECTQTALDEDHRREISSFNTDVGTFDVVWCRYNWRYPFRVMWWNILRASARREYAMYPH